MDSPSHSKRLSIIIPAKNEAAALMLLLPQLRQQVGEAEIVVVNDGSNDDTSRVAREHGAKVINHPYSIGNGAAVKAGARAASGEILVFMDGDGQHDPADIPQLLATLDKGFDMVVGARHRSSQATLGRLYANSLYNRLASWMVNQPIADLTSGFRAVRANRFREFIYLLPNGFSYPTTITMCFFRAGYPVSYMPIHAKQRIGKSHINPLRDGVRFMLIIFKIGTLYSPLKLFLPISAAFFFAAAGYYAYTYTTTGRFTNMSGLLFTTSVIVFLIGLVSEQITSVLFSRRDSN
ncbi:MAG TPA: glycosyltransferase family 2 protein [Burkholderiales bacterium]|nr:glycosyltransferase family 2 protein [Burkholderiales bacterium]